MRRCGGFYIPFAPPGDPAPVPLRMKFRWITSDRTEHFCNFDGIAKTLFCCHRKCPPEHGQSLSAVSGRKRYNTLDFAGQNRVPKAGFQPSFGNLLDTGNTISARRTEMLFASIHFPRHAEKRKGVFCSSRGK